MSDKEKTLEEQLREQRRALNRQWGERLNTILDAMKARFGPEAADVLDELTAKETRQQWAEIASTETSHTIDDLIRLLWDPLTAKGFGFTSEHREDGVQMHCTRCPIVDYAKKTGGLEWAYHLYCVADPHIVEGFNPQIGFRRTKTLMEGHECCDHFYYMK